MKTPDEVKNGLECCGKVTGCYEYCPYYGDIEDSLEECTSNLAIDALALIEQLEARIPKWISYKEESPQEAGSYLVRCIHWYSDNDGYECYNIACFDPNILWVNIGNLLKVTHWMPLPSMPKED